MTARAKRIARWTLTAAFFVAVAWLLQRELRELDPREIFTALRALSAGRIAVALLVTAVAYAVVATYDRLSTRYAGVRLPARLGFAIPFVSYAFNFNLGAIVGGIGFRFRLYSREGVDSKRIGAIAAFSIVTNWCGCLTVLGAMLIADPSVMRAGWDLPPTAARLLGVAAWAPVAAYLIATWIRRAPVRIRGGHYPVPDPRIVLAQVGLASSFWLLAPLVLHALRPPGAAIAYSQLVVAYSLASLGGLIVRIPAGLGVIEAVFLEIFGGRVGAAPILGMLIAWRAVFLLVPLAAAALVLAALEFRWREAGPARRERTPV